MEPIWSKFDRELIKIYSNYLLLKHGNRDSYAYVHPALANKANSIHLTLQYSGSIASIQSQGFELKAVERDGLANGKVLLDLLAQFSTLPEVIKLSYGEKYNFRLKESVEEIEAKGSNVGFNAVWSIVQSNGTFIGLTGENVIIGVIDTGIEWRHKNFINPTSNKTRILSIWDQGLIPKSGTTEKGPDIAMLSSGTTDSYGVEYTKDMIDEALADSTKLKTIRHRDCLSHGTHVAGIAAGNGVQKKSSKNKEYEYIGVAPKADLVVVKGMLHENEPSVNYLTLFKDAVTYILNIAKREAKQVVINFSAGSNLGPHDGLIQDGDDGMQTFLENIFAVSRGQIFVSSAGNDSGSRHHGIIKIPSSGKIKIPFRLSDKRTIKKDFWTCVQKDRTEPVNLSFWYDGNIANLNLKLSIPKANVLNVPNIPVPLNGIYFQVFDKNKVFNIHHFARTTKRNGVNVTRNNINIEITPHKKLFFQGIYEVELFGPQNTEIHVWCETTPGGNNQYGFKIDETAPADIRITDSNTINSPADSPSVIAVAAYEHITDQMACFSSKGPLVDYSRQGPLAAKPDLAAPGNLISSANSYNTSPIDTYSKPLLIQHYVYMGGTSMATPHVTGLIALMLQKKPNQSFAEIKQNLISGIRPRPIIYPDLMPCDDSNNDPTTQPLSTFNESGNGKIGANKTMNNIS